MYILLYICTIINYIKYSIMYRNLTTLFEYRVKKIGLICAGIILALDLITYLIPGFTFVHYDHHILFHYMILVCLLTAVTSKDKLDDELSRQIRYSVFKNTLTLSVTLIAVSTMIMAVFGIERISTIIIVYFLEGMLGLHLLLYHIGHRYNHAWLLSEKTAPEFLNRSVIRFMVLMVIVIAILIILTAFAKQLGI
jgi:hypothetical protein